MKKLLCPADAAGIPASVDSFRAVWRGARGHRALVLSGHCRSGGRGGRPSDEPHAGQRRRRLEEIIVTAEKRESTVQATPIAMSALSAGDLMEQNITSIQDLVGAIPGISLRTAGPGQTEYEMRGLASSGGSVATVGFYIDETPLSASAVALNGRTVIDADLYDLNRTEVLRGPQGTLYGAGSMGGTIKLVTNPPKLHDLEGAAYVDASQTAGGSTNGRGSLMLNIPLGDIAALRFVTTDKYISGCIHRYVIAPGQFPYPTNYGNCGAYYCTRGDVQDAPVADDIKGSNLERFISSRASLLVQPADNLSITGNFMYQRIDADGYNNYQAPPNNQAIYQPTISGAVLRFLPFIEPEGQLRHVVRESDLGIVLLEARCISIDGFYGSAAEHLQLHPICPKPLSG